MGFCNIADGINGKELTSQKKNNKKLTGQCRRHNKRGFDPCGGKEEGSRDPWRRTWQPTPVFLPGESHG